MYKKRKYTHKKPANIIFLLPGILFLILCSCVTSSLEKKYKDFPQQIQIKDNLKIAVSFLNEKKLNERFGKTNNPFISPPSALGLNKILTFNFEIENFSKTSFPLIIELKRIELQFEGKPFESVNRFHLYNFWKLKIEKNEAYRYWISSKVNLIIKENVFPNKLSVSPGEKSTYLLTFMGRFPKYGQVSIYVPVFDKNGNMVNNFRFQFEF